MKRLLLTSLFLCALTFGINAAAPTIKKYKTNDRCYITITEALTDDQVATLKAEIAKGADGTGATPYTSVDLGTKEYALTESDLNKLFAESSGLLQTTTDITALSLKDINIDSDAVSGYGQKIGYLPGLLELTTPKSCAGPNMNDPSPKYKTIKKLIIPKLGTNETVAKHAKATVGCWQGYTTLESVDLNTSISESGIVDNAFYGCWNLKTVKIMSNNIASIGQNAFRDCVSLTKISLPYGLTTIKNGAFYNCYLKNIIFPQTITTIEANAFRGNPFVRTLKIPGGGASHR